MKEITGYFVNPAENIAEPRTINDDLNALYRLLDCDLIDIPTVSINGKPFSVVCNDEGLLEDDYWVSAVDMHGHGRLVGSLFVVSADNDNGNLVGLDDADIALLSRRTIHTATNRHPYDTSTILQID